MKITYFISILIVFMVITIINGCDFSTKENCVDNCICAWCEEHGCFIYSSQKNYIKKCHNTTIYTQYYSEECHKFRQDNETIGAIVMLCLFSCPYIIGGLLFLTTFLCSKMKK